MTDFYEDACYLSNSEAEPDSETEDSGGGGCGVNGSGAMLSRNKAAAEPELAWDDPQALLNTWLGELDSLQVVSLHFTVFFSCFSFGFVVVVFGTLSTFDLADTFFCSCVINSSPFHFLSRANSRIVCTCIAFVMRMTRQSVTSVTDISGN